MAWRRLARILRQPRLRGIVPAQVAGRRSLRVLAELRGAV